MQQELSSQYKANSEAPFRGLASLLALQGRKGDTRLVHMTDQEVRALASTGRLTINPDTGLPEAFNLSSLLPVVLAIAGTMIAPGVGTALGASVGAGTLGGAVAAGVGAGVGSTAGNLLIGKSGEEALKSGLISAGTSGIGSLASGPALEAVSGTAGAAGAAEGAAATAGTEALVAAPVQSEYASLFDTSLNSSPDFTAMANDISAERAAEQAAIDSGTPFKALKDYTSTFGPDYKAGQMLTPDQAAQATGGRYGLLTAGEGAAKDMSVGEASLENIKTLGSSKTPYIRGALSGAAGLALTPPEYEKEAPRPPPKFQDYTLTGGELLPSGEGQDAPLSSAQALAIALGKEERKPVLSQYEYTPKAEGGLIGLFGGGKVAYLEDGSDGDDSGDDASDDAGDDAADDGEDDTANAGPDLSGKAEDDQEEEEDDIDTAVAKRDAIDAAEDYNAYDYSLDEEENKGLGNLITGFVDKKIENVKNNPVTNFLDLAAGFIPGVGVVNTLSSLFGGPTIGKAVTSVGRGIGKATGLSGLDISGTNNNTNNTTENFGSFDRENKYVPKSKKEEEEEASFKGGGAISYHEGRVDGAGDGMSDNVVYRVEGGNPDIAMLSRDEYVLPADVVAMLGNGSSNAGSDKIDKFIKDLRKQSFGTSKQQKEVKNSSKTGLSTLVH